MIFKQGCDFKATDSSLAFARSVRPANGGGMTIERALFSVCRLITSMPNSTPGRGHNAIKLSKKGLFRLQEDPFSTKLVVYKISTEKNYE